MKMFKNVILLSLLVSSSSTYSMDPGSLFVMATMSVVNFTYQVGKDIVGYVLPDAQKQADAIQSDMELEYLQAKKALRSCLKVRKGEITFDEDEFPCGCEAFARVFVECGGEDEMYRMINNINRARKGLKEEPKK